VFAIPSKLAKSLFHDCDEIVAGVITLLARAI
jgi:hypothetical protein